MRICGHCKQEINREPMLETEEPLPVNSFHLRCVAKYGIRAKPNDEAVS